MICRAYTPNEVIPPATLEVDGGGFGNRSARLACQARLTVGSCVSEGGQRGVRKMN